MQKKVWRVIYKMTATVSLVVRLVRS